MAAEPSRRNSKSIGLIVRPQAVSGKTYVESVVGFINEVVPQSKPGEKEFVLWVKFEYCDINDYSLINERPEHDANHPPLIIIMGYTNGVQVWFVPANGDAQEVLSWRQGPVKVLKILKTPQPVPSVKDKFANQRPIVALCDSSSAGEQFCFINFISLKTGDRVDGIKFSGQVVDIQCNKRILAAILMDKVVVYNALDLKEMFSITSCYPSLGFYTIPVALGTRWLAFADRKLSSCHQTCGGMAGDGVQSYAATVIHAAKTITKGLSIFSETVANSFAGHKPMPHPSSQKTDPRTDVHPGIVTIIDVLAVNCSEVNLDEDSEGEGIVAHFPAHANEPVAAMSFDPSGLLLLTCCRLGHNFNVFRIFPHPASSSLGAVHHLYTLHRGDTTAKVQDIAFSLDSRWVAVSTLRGTTHIFPITPYGGQITVRTHTSPRVVNRLSRFHRSAGLEEIQQSSQTGRNSPVLSGSPGSSGSTAARSYDSHPSMSYPSNSLNRMSNSRLPPYPHPVTVNPLFQLKQAVAYPLTTAGKPKSPGKDRFNKRTPPSSENVCVAAAFAPPRAWLAGSPSLTRDKREKLPMDNLFIIDWHGVLVEYVLNPRPAVASPKTDDSPIELDVTAHAQWSIPRPTSSCEIQPPLPSYNPLMFSPESHSFGGAGKEYKSGDGDFATTSEGKADELEESWLSQVEIITHAGPHRRLWMGPQFSFQTFQHHSNTTLLSSTSSALLSQSPDGTPTTTTDIFTEELDVQSLGARPARSNPVAMPGCHQSGSEFPRSPLLIEASSGSFEQLPNMLEVCGSWPEGAGVSHCRGKEEQLRESIADAMVECSIDDPLPPVSRSDTRDFHGSFEELSSGSSHSGSVGHFETHVSSPHCVEHTLVFPTSGGSPDSS